ncbi:phenylalanine--tRNA ligase subunit beta, partial [bacterium]|nr:phenylalanine--tRNA ligase subunit beta [bacterium]
MKISLNWIKDFVEVDPGISSQELVKTITLSVCEVEGYEETGAHLKDVFVAKVKEIQPHPDAEKLSLVTVDYGNAEQRVVCGASNFDIGDKVVYAGEGTTLPGGFTIKKTVIRGVESCGMLCAEDELGFSDDHAGLMVLAKDIEVGITLDKIFPDQVDLIMEIDNKSITHRPDLWGHYGFARELGTIYRLAVKKLDFDINSVTGLGERIINVEVQAGELVPRFCGLSVDNVKIVSSPLWIQHRLTRVGLRPINNIVDLTNFVMLELGQPMHAFDAEQIAGKKLIVRLADPGTKVMTLYQKEVSLGENDMTICDANGASVVAGVIGGLNSGVTENTGSIFLEAANWDPVGIRKTSTRIGLRTDACQRFEKSLDPEMSPLSIQRAVEIMYLTNPDLKIRGELVDIVNKKIDPITIEITTEFISDRLGKKIDDEEIKEILSYLGFAVKSEGTRLLVEVPSFRRTKDVSIKEDIVEEIGRIHGFNNIKPQAPKFPIDRPVFNLRNKFENKAKAVLCESNYHEVVNYPLTCQKTEDVFGLKTDGIMKLQNPVSDHQNQMRTSLLPHLVQTISDNQKISFNFRLFEIGRTYR